MTDGTDLLAAILAHPEEDTPRLMYADWLDENGQPERAEFIRLQIAVNRIESDFRQKVSAIVVEGIAIKATFSTPELLAARSREKRLLPNNLDGPEYDWAGPAVSSCFLEKPFDWHRGFIRSGRCEAAGWFQHGEAILAAHPIRRVRLTTMPTAAAGWNDGTNETLLAWLSCRWPGVEFGLPKFGRLVEITSEAIFHDTLGLTLTPSPESE